MPRPKIALPANELHASLAGSAPSWGAVLAKLRIGAGRVRDWGLRVTGYLPTYTLRLLLYRMAFGMDLASGVKIEGGCVVWGPSRIRIGEGSVINRKVTLDGRFPLTIGRHTSISLHTIILTLQHDLSDPGFASAGAPVVIGDRVFIGARAIILPGVTIGEGAAVGAGAVVTKDIEPYSIVAGVPAKPVGIRPRCLTYRFS